MIATSHEPAAPAHLSPPESDAALVVETSPTELAPEHRALPHQAPPALVLASASPRRRELLTALGARFQAVATNAEDEDMPTPARVASALPALAIPPANHPTLLAWRKAHTAAEAAGEAVVLGADTVVVRDSEVLNKPVDADHARAMLRSLSGRTHTVYTGLCVLRDGRMWLELVASEVSFHPLSDELIDAYIATGEPFDKAGAYGLQGLSDAFVRSVHGSYTAVVGLPLPATHRLLSAAGVAGLHDPALTYQRWLASQGKEPLPCPPSLP
jgi:septum formation protein